MGFYHPMQVQPFQGWVEDSCLPWASLRTVALSPRLFIFVPLGDRTVDKPALGVQDQICGNMLSLDRGTPGGLQLLQTLADFSNEPLSRRITSFSGNHSSPATHRNVKASPQRHLWCSHASQN